MINLNLYLENEYKNWEIDIDEYKKIAQDIFNFYISVPKIYDSSCLKDYNVETVSFDFLFCDSEKTLEINREYRGKNYPADIITFAVFADSPKNERFILDMEINLGEIIIGLDKIIAEAESKKIPAETELMFMISHGILHLLGFDHQTEEEFKFVVDNQKLALKSLGINYDKI